MNKEKLLACLLWIAVTTALAACQREESVAIAQPKAPPPAVRVTPVVHKKVIKTYELVGRTAAVKTVNLVARVQGYLEKRNFKEGEEIEKGQLLFIIEQAPYKIAVRAAKAKVAEARATLENAKAYLNRVKSVRKGGVSQSDLDKANSDFLKAESGLMEAHANLDQAKLNLSYTKIRSPINGRIGRVSVNEGNLVSLETGPLATLVQMDPMYVLFTVDSGNVLTEFQNQIKKGKATTFTPRVELPNGTLYPFEGIEDFVSHTVDEKTGTITIRAVFSNPSNNVRPGKAHIPHTIRLLMPGQFVKVFVKRDDVKMEKVIPQIAIQEDQTGKFVLVVDAENRVHKRSVRLGEKHGIQWIVKEGLEVGERVISEGLQKVRPGVTVQTSSEPETQPGKK